MNYELFKMDQKTLKFILVFLTYKIIWKLSASGLATVAEISKGVDMQGMFARR